MSDLQADAPRGNVLIVDDTPANLRLLSQMLAERGYRVRPVPDGALALAAVQAEPPDLILLDIRMPGIDGYQVCERLKADPQARDIPVIFISALDAIEDKVRAFTVGGADYVTKPFQVEEVLARVGTHLALRRLQRQLQDANRKMAQELALAGKVQTSFLPHNLPDLPGWQLAAALKPARETSGDFYDWFHLPNGHLGIVIADVCDKGAGAALYMALSWTLIRTYAGAYPAQPELALSAVNRRMAEDTDTDYFVTLFYGILDPDRGTLAYCNAGHWGPYLVGVRDSAHVQRLIRTGPPLGVSGDHAWERGTASLAPGDVLVLYTDGVTEAQDACGSFLGEDRLLASVRSSLGRPARGIHEAILEDVQRFVGDTPQSDDIALVVLSRDTGADGST
ncbi:MAG: SpoIIE family protein phosphatase [Anaerolineae bacterium]|nr:SpoIIE family protein phosphatase [Anaerolineae bacterium]